MEGVACYTVRALRADPPAILPFSPIKTYIITLRGSDRDYRSQKRLTEQTFVVENAGFRNCAKAGVVNSAQDLLHANQFICRLEEDNPLPVFILEDDFEMLDTDPHRLQACIDVLLRRSSRCAAPDAPAQDGRWNGAAMMGLWHVMFLSGGARGLLGNAMAAAMEAGGVDAVALGAIPWWVSPVGEGFYRIRFGGATHAMLYSPRARREMLAIPTAIHVPHDGTVFTTMVVITPEKPLAGQVHLETPNMKDWDPAGNFKKVLDTYGCGVNARACYAGMHGTLRSGGLQSGAGRDVWYNIYIKQWMYIIIVLLACVLVLTTPPPPAVVEFEQRLYRGAQRGIDRVLLLIQHRPAQRETRVAPRLRQAGKLARLRLVEPASGRRT